MRFFIAAVALVTTGCVRPPDVDLSALTLTGTESEGAAETGASDDPTASDDADASDEASTGEHTTSSADTESSAGCAEECGGEPELLWLTTTDEIYGDGACLTVISDGQGGLVASFRGSGFETYGDVVAVDASGHIAAMGGNAEGGLFPGLSLRGPGLLDWASLDGRVGIADTTLANLEGGPLAFDVAEIRAMAADEDRLRYVARVSPSYNCVVRVGADPEFDSVPFTCAPTWTPEELHRDAMESWYYFEPWAYRVVRFDPVGLSWGSLEGRWNRVALDGAVDRDGQVWFVGAIGSGFDTVFGSFVARHDFGLAEEPAWELSAEDDVVWSAIATTPDGAIVLGHRGYGERLVGMGLTLDGDPLWSWEHEPEPRTYVDAISVDDAGDVIACGTRYTGVQTPVGSDVHNPMFLKLSL
jgi:hypothetical protein